MNDAVVVRFVAILVVVAACAKSNGEAPPGDGGPDAIIQPDACVPLPESCNGMDEDCDGFTDEDFDTTASLCIVGVGACAASGVYECNEAGDGIECSAVEGAPALETCDGIDNDCDMKIDETFNVGTPCDGTDADVCSDGVIMCTGPDTAECNDGAGDSPELCDTFDNDCDGKFDEGFNLMANCDGADTDSCNEGKIVCNGPTATKCTDTTTSTVERCNGLDDDCSNGPDDTYNVGQACSDGLGACLRNGMFVCNAGMNGTRCNAAAGAPTAETCGDAIDQDCTGADAACPANDLPAGAIDISAGGTFSVDLSAARDDNFAPSTPSMDCAETGGRDVFYQFTLPAEEVVYADTFGSNFDSVLRLYNGTCASLGAIVTCSDDACTQVRSQIAEDLAAGTYCLVVDQFRGTVTTGAATLVFKRGGRAGARLPARSGSVTGTNVGKPALYAASCEAETVIRGEGVHFFPSCPGNNSVSAETCTATTIDTVMYLRTGTADTADVVCGDDNCGVRSKITKVIAGANIQWVIVDGFAKATSAPGVGEGPYTLTYSY